MGKYGLSTMAFYDAGSVGLIPCKVVGYSQKHGDMRLEIRLTANRQAYKRGEVLAISPNWVYPRACVYTRLGHYRVRPHEWVTTTFDFPRLTLAEVTGIGG